MPFPTEEEVQDAMAVLKESQGEVDDNLEKEAFRIFDEVGQVADRGEAAFLDSLRR